MNQESLVERVKELSRSKPNQRDWTVKEEEMVYRLYYSELEIASEEQLRYRIKRYSSKLHIVKKQWFVLLLKQFPTEENFSIFESTGCYHREILNLLISEPDVTISTLQLIIRRVTSRKKRSPYWRALRRIGQLLKDSWSYEI